MERVIYDGRPPEKEIFQIFSETMEELILSDSQVAYIDADLMASLKTKDLWEKYPRNVFNTGIQEANMIGVAAGMYLYGRKPYVHSFAPFASRRCFDQIYISIGYGGKGVRIIGSEPGICASDNGGTHMAFEDIAMMRAIPGACVIDVSDGTMFRALLKKTKDMQGVIYFRTPRRGLCDIYPQGTDFEIGRGRALTQGEDCTVIASGIMTATALEAYEILREKGIYAQVIDPITIKPMDAELICESARRTKNVITAENHSVCGGLGGAVAEILAERCPVRMKRIGICEEFGQVGNEAYLREHFRLTAEEIAAQASRLLGV